MGGHYGSIQVRSDDFAATKSAAEKIAHSKKIRMLIAPPINGWIGIYPEHNGQDNSLGKALARQLPGHLLQMIVHDDDIFAYWLYLNGKLVDSFWSHPGYFDEADAPAEENMKGDSKAFLPLIGNAADKLKPILASRGSAAPAFASESLEAFAKVLGIANALQAYEYLLEDDPAPRVKQRDAFLEIPDAVIARIGAQTADAAKKSAAKVAALQTGGKLLLSDDRSPLTPQGCAVAGGFLVIWSAPLSKTFTPVFYAPPWDKPVEINWQPPSSVFRSSADGTRLVFAAHNRLSVFDLKSGAWKHLVDIETAADHCAISADGKFVAAIADRSLEFFEVSKQREICAFYDRHHARTAAVHPDGNHVAFAGTALNVVRYGPRFKRVAEFLTNKQRQAEFAREWSKARKKGAPPPADVGESLVENPRCIGFTRDGRFLWCGTDAALYVFEFPAVLEESDDQLTDPVYEFRPPAGKFRDRHILDAVEEIAGSSLIFLTGREILRLDLSDGSIHPLHQFPVDSLATSLSLSTDGKFLATATSIHQPLSLNVNFTFQIWNYAALKDLE